MVINVWFYIDQNSHVPVYKQICEKIKGLIISKKLEIGDFVPSVRRLAKDLGVNVNTVARAYRELVNEDVLQPIKGEGYIVKGTGKNLVKEKLEELRKILSDLKSIGVNEREISELVREVFRDASEG